MKLSKYVMFASMVALVFLINGCVSDKVKAPLPDGFTSVVQHSIDPKFGGYNTETFYKNGQWFKAIAHFDNGARYYEKYYMKQDTTSIIHSLSFYPDGALMVTSVDVNNVPTVAQGYFENGRKAWELNVPAGYNRMWDSTGHVLREK